MAMSSEMLKEIISCAVKCGIALIALYLYLLLVCRLYPWFTMTLVWRGKDRHMPRGIRKVVFEGGRGVVYEPALYVRKYISKYAIFVHEGSKFIRCQINPNIKKIKYDIVSFNAKGKMLDIMCVKEQITSTGETNSVALPTDTSYAFVIPRKIDSVYRGKEAVVGYSAVGAIVFFVLTVITTVVMSWFLNDGLGALASLGIANFAAANPAEVLLRGLLCGVTVGAIALLAYFLHSIRVINR